MCIHDNISPSYTQNEEMFCTKIEKINTHILLQNKKPTICHLLFYCTSYRLNILRALLCPSSGARDYDVDYHISLSFLVCCMLEVRCGRLEYCPGCSLQPGHYSSTTAPNLQHTANQERYEQCGNQHYSRELLMAGIVMPAVC